MKVYLVTGAAGFIGFHVAQNLLKRGEYVIGIDNLNNYYSVQLKKSRLALLEEEEKFTFYKIDLGDYSLMNQVFNTHPINTICHLAAQAGVRYSIENPFAYQKSNLEGFLNILELGRQHKVTNFVYASSSSVYGNNQKLPFSESDNVDHPISLYAASKKANELMAHSYSHLYQLPTTGLRFFTVYGPWGRPDMAMFKFTNAILNNQPIDVYNHGDMKRDFTYIDDIVNGVIACLDHPEAYRIFNIGNHHSEELEHCVKIIESCLNKKAIRNYLPMQDGDVKETFADIEQIQRDRGYVPKKKIEEGIPKFIEWFLSYYNVKN